MARNEVAIHFLTHLHEVCILMHMRTTVNINDDLLKEAMAITGISEKTALIHAGLKELVAREAARRLAAMGGTMPDLVAPRRRRSPRVSTALRRRKAG